MKTYIFAVLALFTLINSAPAYANSELEQNARDALRHVKVYSIGIDAIYEISVMISNDPEELVERDLALCTLIGEAEGDLTPIGFYLNRIKNELGSKPNERKILDDLFWSMIHSRATMLGFCMRIYKGEYRNIPYLQSRLEKIYADIEAMNKKLSEFTDTIPYNNL